MRKAVLAVLVALCGALVVSVPASAHHSAIQFDFGKSVPIKGVVIKFEAINPHMRLILRVTAAKGTRATIYALDAITGKELWSSGEQIHQFNHFSGVTVANGRIYLGTYDGTLYCFGVDSAPAATR